ncbi:MAG: carbohydrate kinase family protein [Phycisphaerales bacterium JB063]
MAEGLDVVVAGSCVMDLICRPVVLDRPIGGGALHAIEPPLAVPGGITSNAGIAMSRLGLSVGVASYVGDDAWGKLLRNTLRDEAVDTAQLRTHPEAPTSTTVVLVDPVGERSFLHAQGAPKQIDASFFLADPDAWRGVGWLLMGYFPLMPRLLDDLPGVMRTLKQLGCKTALDSAGGREHGGSLDALAPVLPHLDLYIPSLGEAQSQTGQAEPGRMIERYRAAGGAGILGIKLGAEGVLLSPRPGALVHSPSTGPPGAVVDTTGAGDCFLAGMIAGLSQGLDARAAGELGCVVAAQSVTALGGWSGVKRRA